MRVLTFLSLLCVAPALVVPAMATDPMAEAKHLFSTYVSRLNAFDPAVVDLYADSAKIQNTRFYPDGTNRTVTVPIARYKAMIRSGILAAKKDHDTSNFLGVEYTRTGDKVQIEAIRFSRVAKEGAPIKLVVGAVAGGKWRILEEYTESRPQRR